MQKDNKDHKYIHYLYNMAYFMVEFGCFTHDNGQVTCICKTKTKTITKKITKTYATLTCLALHQCMNITFDFEAKVHYEKTEEYSHKISIK